MGLLQRWKLARQARKLQRQLHVPVSYVVMSDYGSFDFLATNTQLKAILGRRIAPILAEDGFAYNGDYIWFGPWEGHCRRVVRVYLLKGASAIFQWGLCFDFLPVFNGEGKNLRYQRTDKNVGMHLFTWPEGHWNPEPGKPANHVCRFSLFGKNLEDVEQQVIRAFEQARPSFERWFGSASGLDGALREAERQIGEKFSINWPSALYVRAFLLSANGRPEEGAAELERFFEGEAKNGHSLPAETREKLQKKLRDCAVVKEEK